MNKNRAFTLIELLVVIAIIAILAAILFPVFAQAKTAAKKTQALSNIKQMGTAVQMYLTDYDDVYPMGGGGCWWHPLDGGWVYDTQPYVKNVQILISPADPKSKTAWPAWLQTHPNGSNISVVANGLIRWDGSRNSLRGLMTLKQGQGEPCGGWMGSTTRNATEVTNPSSTIMFAERFGSQPTWGPGSYLAGVTWWDNNTGLGGQIPNGARTTTVDNSDGRCNAALQYIISGRVFNQNCRNGGVTPGYSNVAVFTMSDTSAKAMNPVATNPNEGTRPADNMWDSLRS